MTGVALKRGRGGLTPAGCTYLRELKAAQAEAVPVEALALAPKRLEMAEVMLLKPNEFAEYSMRWFVYLRAKRMCGLRLTDDERVMWPEVREMARFERGEMWSEMNRETKARGKRMSRTVGGGSGDELDVGEF